MCNLFVSSSWPVLKNIIMLNPCRYLPYHLDSSKQYGELLQLFFDFNWLQHKVKETNLASLISDFRFLGTASHEIKLLKSSLMLSADVIEKTPDSIGPQLLGIGNHVS